MRNAWIAGFAWSGFIFVGLMGLLLPTVLFGIQTRAPIDLSQFIYFVIEVGLVSFLSYGVLQRRRNPAILLFGYFVASRVVLVAIGAVPLATPRDMVPLLIQALVIYFFFQGMRGAWTFHHLTHPQYPSPKSYPGEREDATGPAQSGGEEG